MIEYPLEMMGWVLGLAFVLGLCFGSFANVMALRLLAECAKQEALEKQALEQEALAEENAPEKTGGSPQADTSKPQEVPASMGVMGLIKEYANSFAEVFSLVSHPPSHCPHCEAPIEPFDNIPVLSYVLLGGKCRHCKAPISVIYPAFELLCGILFAGVVWQFGLSWQSLLLCFLVFNLVVITITDLKESFIFQVNSLTLIPVGILYNVYNLNHTPQTAIDLGTQALLVPDGLISAILAMVLAFVFFEGMILLSEAVFGTEGFGHGDTHLMMGVGAFLGWEMTAMSLALGFLFQCVLAIPMLVIQWIRDRNYPSLISGGIACLCVAVPLWVFNLPKDSPVTPHAMTIALSAMGLCLVSLFFFLRQVKQNQSFTYVPLGPALVLASLVSLFWGQPVLSAILKLYTH